MDISTPARRSVDGLCHDDQTFRWILSDFSLKKTDGYDGDDLWTYTIYDDQTMMIFDDLWITMIYDLVMIFEYLWWSMMTKLWSTKLCADHSHGFKMELNALNLRSPTVPLFRITPNALVHHSHRCRSKNNSWRVSRIRHFQTHPTHILYGKSSLLAIKFKSSMASNPKKIEKCFQSIDGIIPSIFQVSKCSIFLGVTVWILWISYFS